MSCNMIHRPESLTTLWLCGIIVSVSNQLLTPPFTSSLYTLSVCCNAISLIETHRLAYLRRRHVPIKSQATFCRPSEVDVFRTACCLYRQKFRYAGLTIAKSVKERSRRQHQIPTTPVCSRQVTSMRVEDVVHVDRVFGDN